jgi:hypothetical protein
MIDYMSNQEMSRQLSLAIQEDFRRRQAAYRFRSEADHAPRGEGIMRRSLVGIGDRLITAGLRLRIRQAAGSTVAIVGVRDCRSVGENIEWCVCPAVSAG